MSSIRKGFRFTPSGVVATIALVFAMTGGAYAAKKYLITSTKQISPSVLKTLKGANGKPGVAGATGAAGPAGTAGTAGGVGPAGTAGTAGTAGADGKEGPPGKSGKEGKEGSPWTAGGVLPSGKTETGTFALNPTTGAKSRDSISFTIPLAAPIDNVEEECGEAGHPACVTHVFVEEEPIPAGCAGTVVEGRVTDLQADPGNFCAWVQFSNGTFTGFEVLDVETATTGVGRTGAILAGLPAGGVAFGSWAVTAP